jgi:hypothetical protein
MPQVGITGEVSGSAGVQPEAHKKIRWLNNRWECDPFIVELFLETETERIPVNIDPKTVKISDTRDWLEQDGPPVRGDEDKKWQVPVKIKESRLKEIAPQGYNPMYWQYPRFVSGNIPKETASPPNKELTTTLTVFVDVISSGDLMGSSVGLAGGMVPGVGGIVSGVTPKETVKSHPVEYVVVPPVPVWTVQQKKPIPLSGKGEEETLTITLSPMPDGWDSGLLVTCALPVEASKKRGLEIVSVQDTMSDASKGINTPSEGTIQLGDQPQPDIFSGGIKPDRISAEIRVKNTVACFKKVSQISDPPSPDKFLLLISTKNDFIGSQLEKTVFDIQPVEICIYLDKYPENEYPWNEKPVRVIRKGTQGVPERSKLSVSLHYTRELEPDPGSVNWSMTDTSLDDGMFNTPGFKVSYHAPSQDSWEGRNKIELRQFKCLVGPGSEEVIIEDDLCTTALLESAIELKPPLGFAKVLVSVRPSTFPADPAMLNLSNSKVYDSIHRKFRIIIDLQEISGTPQNSTGTGTPSTGVEMT